MTDPLSVLLLVAAVSAPVSLDILTRIINVHWEEGLAVEFFDGADGDETA